jgi:RNA polymerase sigma-70 factor (ECF subfamily)
MAWTSAVNEARAGRIAVEMATPDETAPSALDQRRFSQLVVDHRRRLYCYLVAQGASPDLAEDCVQEALVRGYRSLGSLRDWNRAAGWLFGIARHVYLDETRRAAVRERPVAIEQGGAPEPADEAVERAELALSLRRAVADLPPPRPEVIALRYSVGLSVDEIAVALELPVGTVKTHLFRARAALRKRLVAQRRS